MAILLIAGCSSTPPPHTSVQVAEQAMPPLAATPSREPAPLEIRGVEARESNGGIELAVSTSGPLVWTSYRDDDGNLVVELPNSVPTARVAGLDLQQGMVESARLDVENGGDRPLTRLVVRTDAPAEHSVEADGSNLVVGLTPVGGAARQPTRAEPVAVEQIADLAPFQEPAVEETNIEPAPAMRGAGTPDSPVVGPAPAGVPATQLQGVEVSAENASTVVWILGDGAFYYSTFALDSPERFVVDLNGVVKTVPISTVPVGSSVVERVRVAQFKPQPDLVSRVVIDLVQPAAPEILATSEGLKLTFREGGVANAAAVAPPVYAPAESAPMDRPQQPIESPPPAPSEMAPEPAMETAAAMEPEPEMETAPAPALEMAAPVETAPPPAATPAAAPMPRDREPRPMPPSARPEASDLDLFQATDVSTSAAGPQAGFEARAVGGEPEWTGEPMTMTLKDADIKDVLRSFHEISGLNIVVQPGVSGSVTVELTQVPWDQALQMILKTNGLDYQLEGNIMRIAPVEVLRQEAEEQQRLVQAQSLSIPLRTIIRRVSYGSAADIARVLRSGGGASILSQRGSVVVDTRTNTLIIKELPSIISTVISVIENLDVPEPQVIIEARIIETTKRFTRSLGVQWGIDAISSAALGNTTGLIFPNNGEVSGGVNLLTGAANGFLDISLGNVLDTFRLDAVLNAAESEGLINILSAPKIATLNNERASIQSGLQIPIQTIANNTVSVQFINATLRLDVTPHVTAAGTVLMDIDIQKREPQLAFAVQGAQNAPIATKDARTRVIVRDGGTTVIGGIYQVTSDQGEDRVPGLANIPILKHLFKNKRRTDENEELLIFITPRVVKL